jgi:hypothetical protein
LETNIIKSDKLFHVSDELESSHYITTHANLNLEKIVTATPLIISERAFGLDCKVPNGNSVPV